MKIFCDLKEEERFILNEVDRFGRAELGPNEALWEEAHSYSRSAFNMMADQGYAGLWCSEDVGGTAQNRLISALVFEVLARHSFAAAAPLTVHNMVASLIDKFGGKEQRTQWVPQMTSGKYLGAFCLTEPGAGSDALSIETKAERRPGKYILNGRKIFITSGGEADIYLVIAKTGRGRKASDTAAFIVTKGSEGLAFGKPEKKMGYWSSPTTDVILDGVRVHEENRLGREGDGFFLCMKALDGGRINIGACAVGLAQAALDYSLAYAKERVQFGHSISHFQAIQFKLADMATEIQAARLLVCNAAKSMDQDRDEHVMLAAMAKCFASDVAMRVTTEGVQILGGYGYMRDYPVERYMRMAKVTQIAEGTNEIQRIIIARKLMDNFRSEYA